jgi:hypothetical protein
MAVPALLTLALVGCGSTANATNAANAAATNCPTPGANAFTSVNGVVTALNATSATVKTSSGANATVLFTATTRVSKTVSVDPATLTTGTTVQVVVSQSGVANGATPAQAIIVFNGQGFGGGQRGGNGSPRPGAGSGTPRAGFNPACRTRNQGAQAQNGFRGVRGMISAVNPAAHQITVTDAKGGNYVFALTSSTTVATQQAGKISDLAVGDTISASGKQSATGLQAMVIQDVKTAK